MKIYEVMWKDEKKVNKRRFKNLDRAMNLFNLLIYGDTFAVCGIVAMDVERYQDQKIAEAEQ